MPLESLINTRVVLALIGYCIFAGILILWKPSFIYDNDQKNFRKFGVGRSETLLSLEVVLVLTAIVAYTIACIFSSGSVFEGFGLGKLISTPNSETPTLVPSVTPSSPLMGQQSGGGGGGGGERGDFLYKHPMNDSIAATSFFHQPTQPYYHKPSITFPPSRIWKSSSFTK